MNILILSCGTRNKLVEYFKKSGCWDKVVATDCSEYAPALMIADKNYIVRRMDEDGYIDELLSVCRNEEIDAVLPLHEDELVIIAENRSFFESEGIVPVISDFDKVKLCRDKLSLNKFLNSVGISAVETYPIDTYMKKEFFSGPFFVKPRFGAGSVNTFRAMTREMLSALQLESGCDSELIVQQAAEGEEYGIDLYVDLISGKTAQVFIKKKIRMRAGETDKSVSVVNEKLALFAANAAEAVGLKGPVDMDIFVDGNVFTVLEINPRFGGGYPHAAECGMDIPALIAVNVGGGVNSCPLVYSDGVVAMRYSDICTIEKVAAWPQ